MTGHTHDSQAYYTENTEHRRNRQRPSGNVYSSNININ